MLCVFSVTCLYMFDSESLKFLHTTDVYVNFASGPIVACSLSNLPLVYRHIYRLLLYIDIMNQESERPAWWDQINK